MVNPLHRSVITVWILSPSSAMHLIPAAQEDAWW